MKFFKAIVGFFYFLFSVRNFKGSKVFYGKKIAVVGAADSLFEKENGSFIDSFDLVVRLNKAVFCWQEDMVTFTGHRTDILVHNLYENTDKGGGGPLDFSLFKKHKVSWVLNPKYTVEGFRCAYNYYKKYLLPNNLFFLDRKTSKDCMRLFPPGIKPTMGFFALFTLLQSDFKELFITGFTFFRSPYAMGYRDGRSDNDNRPVVQGRHLPDLEYKLFCDLLSEINDRRIFLDSRLYEIIRAEGIPMTSNIQIR